ncbi:restriction endonuclease subunit S [Coprococcus sp. TF11-13]|uniref:restriction endonuclease subunit S n=1 Tax=Coprococcus sp. TF11-13 TaxID=2293096 RepID=UPI000E4CBEAF|nr:restriction endonuclease subunit S [Coprococcus sp. TF11-13]RHU54075.1 restriction endonuclease subunit S [Coprococcus sp. TF11-13]
MSNWKEKPLSEYCEFQEGYVNPPKGHSEYFGGDIKWCRAVDINNGYVYSTSQTLTDAGFNSAKKSAVLFKPNTIVITKSGTIGRLGIIKDYMCGNRATINIIPKNNADVEFVFYLLRSRQNEFFDLAVGSVQKNLYVSILEKMMFKFPSLYEQKKIASFFSVIDKKIDINNRINRNLSEQAKALFEEELLKFDSVPEGWKKGSLSDIADYLNGLAMQKFRPGDDEKGLPVLKIKELRQGSCDANSELCSLSIKPEYIIHDGDVIFSWSGSLLVDFWCGGECGLNQHLFKVTSKKYDKWFYYAWTLYHLDRFIAVAADKATTMGHIKREELSKAEVLIPDSDSYKRIGEVLGPLYDIIISNRVENRRLATLRDELLPMLMSGEMDVSEVEL